MAILCVPEKLQRKVVTWQWHGERETQEACMKYMKTGLKEMVNTYKPEDTYIQ